MKTWITGTLTFRNEWSGDERFVRITPFEANSNDAWVDIIDEAADRTPGPPGWINVEENLTET